MPTNREITCVYRRGICFFCGCTEAEACPGGCAWADPEHLICTACTDDLGERFGELFKSMMARPELVKGATPTIALAREVVLFMVGK